MQKIIPLVLHRVVPNGTGIGFEDIEVSTLGKIIEVCRGRCVSLRESSPFDMSRWNRFLLTFDDGNVSDYEIALPILSRMNCMAAFFIVVEKIGTPHHLSWSQVRELHDAGMTIGSHSLSHPDMRKLDPAGQRRELLVSRLRIEQELGVSVTSFSFPFGKFNSDLLRLARDAGYSTICTSRHGVANSISSPLPRNSINASMSWNAISRTLRAAPATRLVWLLEDMAKSVAQRAVGDRAYRTLRSIATLGRLQ